MKLLLTSAGLTSPALTSALTQLAGKPLPETKILVVITASIVDDLDKTWLIKGLRRIQDLKFKHLDIIDFASLPRSIWLPRFEAAEIVYFAGGNPYHLLSQMRRSGLAELLPELLTSRVYVGHSAGSSIAGPSLGFSTSKSFVPEDLGPQPIRALGLVDFCVRSHLGNPKFPAATENEVRKVFQKLRTPVYAIGDFTAVMVSGTHVTVVGDDNYLQL